MAGKYAIIFLLFLLAGCAQVGSVSGGERDTVAPKPVTDEMEPSNATINYSGNTFVIPFDEYFQLNNPAQTIRMVPPHATVSAEMKKKTLYLSWEDSLEANTTYAIYLNGTVKDLNEGNDTTLQLVFSTGSVLDTTTYTVGIVDAFSGEPQSDITVALFDPKTDRLKSLARSDKGIAKLNYLSPGTYKMVAFEDKNLDLEIQGDERVGFPEGAMITVDTNYFDSIPIRTYQPFEKQRYKVKSFIAPATFELETSAPIRYYGLNSAKINGKDAEIFTNKTEDIYYLVSPDTLGGSAAEIEISHTTDTTDVIDTLTYRFRNKERETPIKLRSTHTSNIAPKSSISYEVYGPIRSWEDSLISILNLEDSTYLTTYTITETGHQLLIDVDEKIYGDFEINFKKGAIQTPFGSTQAFKEKVTLDEESDYGILNIDVSGYSSPIVLEMIEQNEVVKTLQISDPSEQIKLELLKPGSYTFRIVRDANGNGLWDVGSYDNLLQPEQVDTYSKVTKVRANWEIEITLNPTEDE